MVPGKWGLDIHSDTDSSESLGWTSRVGEVDCEEDHVAGLVERIAHTMLEDDEDETERTRGSNLHSQAQTCLSDWDRSIEGMNSYFGLPHPLQKKIDSEPMELLYTELVRLKMEELAAAQQQLAFYQTGLMDAGQLSQSVLPAATVGHSSNRLPSSAIPKHWPRNLSSNKQVHVHSGGTDWPGLSIMQCQTNRRSVGQRLGAPLIYPSGRYLMGLPASRESGGTGVFLPRCRTGPRNLRTHDAKKKTGFQHPVSVGRTGSFVLKKVKETAVDGTSLQYPSCSPLQEVAPDISLPTEWTY